MYFAVKQIIIDREQSHHLELTVTDKNDDLIIDKIDKIEGSI